MDVGCSEEPLIAGLGICADERFIYHASLAKTDHRTVLSVLDRDTLAVLHVQQLPEISDVHSIQRLEDELFVASTGTDEIVAYRMDGCVAKNARVVWSPTGSGTDTHHINSLGQLNGELWCSAFGDRGGESWVTAGNGYVHNVSTDKRLLEGLRQPHSVTFYDGQLYFCNSQAGTVDSSEGTVAFLVGYSRGLAFSSEGTMYAGTSLSRRTTHGADEFLNLGNAGLLSGRCAVVKIPPEGSRLEIGLSHAGFEVYDLLLV